MSEWFQCNKCGNILHRELITANRCPFCGHDCLPEVILKDRDVSPTYIYHSMPNQISWMEFKEEI